MSKIIFFLKCFFTALITFSMASHIYFMSAFDDFLLNKYYMPSIMYSISITMMAVGFIAYAIFFVRKILHKIILLFIILILYSFLTVGIYGSRETGYQNFIYPFIALEQIKTDFNADFELSECDVNYFFYNINNKYNKRILFRGITSIAVNSLCDRTINSPSYSKDAPAKDL